MTAALAADLVYISESVGSGDIKDEITEIPTPIIVAEPYAWDEMGLIIGGGTNQVPDSANITIIYPGHPMAAGYSGDVPVYTDLPGSELIPSGTTGGGAIVIATASGGTQVPHGFIKKSQKGRRLKIGRIDPTGLNVKVFCLLILALHKTSAGIEVIGLEQLRIQLNSRSKLPLRFFELTA